MNKRPFKRSNRVAIEIQKVISEVVHRYICDPRLKSVTVTGVKVSIDLRIAKIYFSIFNGNNDILKIHKGFKSAKGYVKRELARRLNLRYTPEICFFHDESLEYGAKIENLLRSVKNC